MWYSDRVGALLAAVSETVWIFNEKKKIILRNWRDGGTEFQSLFHILNVPRLNSKSLRSAYVVLTNVLLISIRPSDADVNPGGLLDALEKSRPMSTPDFLSLPHFIFIIHTT